MLCSSGQSGFSTVDQFEQMAIVLLELFSGFEKIVKFRIIACGQGLFRCLCDLSDATFVFSHRLVQTFETLVMSMLDQAEEDVGVFEGTSDAHAAIFAGPKYARSRGERGAKSGQDSLGEA